MFKTSENAHIEKFWNVDDKVLNLAERLAVKIPATGAELIHIAHEEGCEDMFPSLTKEEKGIISADGKIPVYSRWEKKIMEGKIAPDTLLTLAGLASFTADQEMLDDRIKGLSVDQADLCLNISYRRIPAATETLSELMLPDIGIFTL